MDYRLTLGNSNIQEASDFYKSSCDELEKHVEMTAIRNENVLLTTIPTDEDVLAFFNRTDQMYSKEFLDFLKEVLKTKCAIFPIAITKAHQSPPGLIAKVQSYDISEQLRQRKLTNAQIETVAVAFTRTIVAQLQPTLTKDNMYLFLSYRRSDGEKIAAGFHDELRVRMRDTFRDINHVLVGDDAQEVIMQNLRKSDAVIFFDSPMCGESKWVALELRTALAMNVPIVWVKVGPRRKEERADLIVKPSGEPHFDLPEIDINACNIDSVFVDQVIHKAFEISREYAMQVFTHLRRIKEMEYKGAISLSLLSRQSMMYEVKFPRPRRFRYCERPIIHVLGLFGRNPHATDKKQFIETVQQLGYIPHQNHGYNYYDLSLMLVPSASQYGVTSVVEQDQLVDSCDEYVTSLENYVRSLSKPVDVSGRAVIISGAFPDCEPEHQQHMTDAVHAFSQAILDRGCKIIFGAHPTFQHLIFNMARQRRPGDYKEAVHMYVSRHFVSDALIEESRQFARITPIDKVEDDKPEVSRAKSLTAMRTTMIQDEEAVCMVVIGGKSNRPDIPPGVDEEIEIAKKTGLQVFLVGSAGGRTAELASEYETLCWSNKLNNMSAELNHELLVSIDYQVLASKILDHMGM